MQSNNLNIITQEELTMVEPNCVPAAAPAPQCNQKSPELANF